MTFCVKYARHALTDSAAHLVVQLFTEPHLQVARPCELCSRDVDESCQGFYSAIRPLQSQSLFRDFDILVQRRLVRRIMHACTLSCIYPHQFLDAWRGHASRASSAALAGRFIFSILLKTEVLLFDSTFDTVYDSCNFHSDLHMLHMRMDQSYSILSRW